MPKVLEVIIKICGVVVSTLQFAKNADKEDVRLVVDSKLDELDADNLPKGDVEIDYSNGMLHDDAVDFEDNWD